MPVAFQTAATTAFTSGQASIAATTPTGVAANDMLIASVIGSGQTQASVTPPSGFSFVRRDDNAGLATMLIYVKKATGSEGATLTFSDSLNAIFAVQLARYSGQDTTTMQDATAVGAVGTSASPSSGSITTVTANAEVVWACSEGSSDAITKPSGLTARNSGGNVAIEWNMASAPLAVAGATGSTFDTGSIGASDAWTAAHVAIRPAALPISSDSATLADATVTITSDAQLGLPSADISGTWTQDDLVTTTNLYSRADESPFNDADFVQSPQGPVNNEEKFRLGALTNPGTTSNHFVKVRYRKDKPLGSTIDLTVNLYAADGTTLIATRTFSDIGGDGINGVADVAIALTTGEAASIPSADYATGLVLGFKANQTSI